MPCSGAPVTDQFRGRAWTSGSHVPCPWTGGREDGTTERTPHQAAWTTTTWPRHLALWPSASHLWRNYH